MKIGVIGATGKAGSLIAEEALNRGHEVTAIVRDASKVQNSKLNVMEKEVTELTTEDVGSFDVLVNAFGTPHAEQHVTVGRHLIDILKGAGNTRLIVVGGAGSLYVDDALTTRLVDTPDFPDAYKPTASNQGQNLQDLKQSSGIRWTFVSPGAFFDPNGPRTGTYTLAGEKLTVNSEGNSYSSYADYAIAIVDEAEKAAHVGERISVVTEAK
ncbi:NAD(P)-dependent oxidoreductase [Paenibacillus hunanensis]|uniref:NAD(P)-dependent oxidoreductase n=1 Tax=Paenibacillus hunanensis TaxID=539262 RepID=UPI002A6AF44B|nr:NAD(P)-dependent oxidoreductase [Paenibacillus hunanensis]WPP41169.1 NAD(P)-dependent oxidoreductase [Paenibacillus hunanensis]